MLWKANATTIVISAQTSVAFLLVVIGIPERPAAPFVTAVQLFATVLMITSIANVASPAAIPLRRISGIANASPTAAATTPPISVASTLPKWAWAMNFGRSGWRIPFWSAGMTSRPAVYAPTEAKPMLPNEKIPELPTKT